VAIKFYNNKCSFRLRSKKIIKNWIKITIEENGYTLNDISIIFCSSQEILRINRKYLNHNYLTDIITFPYNQGKSISADIFICISVVKQNAKDFKQNLKKELYRVIIHGILHLIGYNDITDEQIKEIRKAEEMCLTNLTRYK
jgi:rRNA maturation RNase YbeY